MRKILFLIILFIFNYSFVISQNDCEPCSKQPTKTCCKEFPYLGICFPPAGDSPDDNYSFGEDNGNRFYFITPEVLIFKSGYYEA